MTELSLREPTFLILTALAAGAQHGYGIMTDVAEISGGRVRLRAGTLYAALNRLAAERLVEVRPGGDRGCPVAAVLPADPAGCAAPGGRGGAHAQQHHGGGPAAEAARPHGVIGPGQPERAGRAMDDHFRTSDADRDRAAALLRDHFAAGRLTPEELDARLAAALNAETFGDLRCVLADLPVPAPVPLHVSRIPPEAGRLERGYRRLLFFYPARYRRVHEEEMLAVLVTAAPEGKRRPGIAEAADLIWGALRVRCQPSRNSGEPAWRDALAVMSVILPVIMLVVFAVQ